MEIMDSPVAVFNHSSGTHFKYVKCNYTWTVNTFSLCFQKTGQYLESPTFPDNNEYKWCMLLYPEGKQYTRGVQLSLKLTTCSKKTVQAKYHLSILNKKGEKYVVGKKERACEFVQDKEFCTEPYNYEDLQRSVLLEDDRLTIFCEIWVITDNDSINIPDPEGAMQVVRSVSHLSDDLKLMYENQQFSDITVFADGKEFRAHKAILAARSPVFKAMFQHDMEEKKQNRIDMSDIQSETVQEMLRFIYTGKVLNIKKHAKKLVAAADKYQLETLKEMCGRVLGGNTITTKNFIELLVLADLHNIKQLKSQVITFIHTHIIDVKKSAEWISLVQTNSDLLKQVFINNK